MVERYAVLQLELTIDDLEAGIGHGIGVGVAVIDIGGGQIADYGTGIILIDRRVVEGDVRRDFVDVPHRDGEGLGAAQAT